MGTNTKNVCNEKRNIFLSYKHEIMAKSFMKAVARNIYIALRNDSISDGKM